ncbi:MAG: site-specific integrase [Mariniphaga sp.]|nr:site-specific integrase [Mariniphaga sp.]
MSKDNENKPKYIINYSPGPGINVRLRGKRLANGNISLYLDYYTGYIKTESGNIKTQRKTEYLKIYLFDKPQTPEERQKNKENLDLALNIRNKRESDLLHNPEGFISPQKKKINFFDYCQNYISTYRKGDIRMVTGAVRLFKEFTKESYLKPNQVDNKLITGFRDFLIEKYNGETPNSYLARLKKILKAAVQDGLYTNSPANGISCPVPDGISKAILMPDEIVKLSQTECGNDEVKRAFLFCLNTGLRFVDVVDLKYKHLQNNMLSKQQLKTGKKVNIDLNNNATKLLGDYNKPDESVFTLPSFSSCVRTLKNWAKKAGIEKNLTWHSARHSVGTILIMNGADIITVKGILGQTKVEHTQKYTHIVDELKKKAVDSLPEIEL